MIRKKTYILLGVIVIAGIVTYWQLQTYIQRAEESEIDMELPEEYARLEPLFTKTGPPQPGEWLATHYERGQTYQEYLHSYFIKPVSSQNMIYMQPLGEFSPKQEEILKQTADFIQLYFTLPVQMLPSQPLPSIPGTARRIRESTQKEQVLAQYLLYEVLKPQKPQDAYIFIGFTACDIWPGGAGNYVYGQADESNRIAICSLSRICSDDMLSENRTLCLRRTLKTATHEMCHLFSFIHCPWYLCNSAGCNSLAEMDRHTLELCPQCLAKICYATGADPAKRFEKLRESCKQNGLKEEELFYDKLLSVLQGK